MTTHRQAIRREAIETPIGDIPTSLQPEQAVFLIGVTGGAAPFLLQFLATQKFDDVNEVPLESILAATGVAVGGGVAATFVLPGELDF